MRKKRLKKYLCLAITFTITMLLLSGCTSGSGDSERLRDLDFTVLGENEQPDTLKEIIGEKRTAPFQISYVLGGNLYIAVGYGEQESGGFSISVNELYETEDAIVIDTTLIGPGSAQNVTQVVTYPYIVIKTENIADKPIVFQ